MSLTDLALVQDGERRAIPTSICHSSHHQPKQIVEFYADKGPCKTTYFSGGTWFIECIYTKQTIQDFCRHFGEHIVIKGAKWSIMWTIWASLPQFMWDLPLDNEVIDNQFRGPEMSYQFKCLQSTTRHTGPYPKHECDILLPQYDDGFHVGQMSKMHKWAISMALSTSSIHRQ